MGTQYLGHTITKNSDTPNYDISTSHKLLKTCHVVACSDGRYCISKCYCILVWKWAQVWRQVLWGFSS